MFVKSTSTGSSALAERRRALADRAPYVECIGHGGDRSAVAERAEVPLIGVEAGWVAPPLGQRNGTPNHEAASGPPAVAVERSNE